MKARECDKCKFFDQWPNGKASCLNGHKMRLGMTEKRGWHGVCDDFDPNVKNCSNCLYHLPSVAKTKCESCKQTIFKNWEEMK